MSDPIVIVSAVRTPMGALLGDLSSMSANDLGAAVIRSAVERASLQSNLIDEVYLGNVLSAGQGQAPARQAAIKAGLPISTGAVTLSKICGAGMQATIFAHDSILAGTNDVVLAGGMESMSNSPYLVPKGRTGYRQGHGVLFDHMMLDGLEDAYSVDENGKRRAMGMFAEECADRYRFSREDQNAYAIESVNRALAATRSGHFAWEIAPVIVKTRAGEVIVDKDEGPQKARPEKIPTLKSAFRKDGTVTAAASSSINDGAAALILMRETTAKRLGCTPLARVIGHARHSQAPEVFTTAPIPAIHKLYAKVGWSTRDVDLFEINEAFAVVPMAAMKDLDIPHGKVNIHGGACVLGHPIGASGARIIVTLIGALRASGGRNGVAAICIGGGEATAMAIQLCNT